MIPTFIDTFYGLIHNSDLYSEDRFYMNEHGRLLLDDAAEKAKQFFVEINEKEIYPRRFLEEGLIKKYFETPHNEAVILNRSEHQKELYKEVKDSEKDLIIRGHENSQYFMAFPIKDFYVLEFDKNRATFIYKRDTFEELIDIFGNDIPIDSDDYEERIVHNELRSIRMVWLNTVLNYIKDNQ